jgi:hypothetical protein
MSVRLDPSTLSRRIVHVVRFVDDNARPVLFATLHLELAQQVVVDDGPR